MASSNDCLRGQSPSGDTLQNREAAVLPKVAIEGNCVLDAQPFHHHEAERVAERVGLVLVGSNESDGMLLISQTDALNSALRTLKPIKELNGATTCFAGPHEKQRIGLDHNRVGGNQLPGLGVGTFEEVGSAFVELVLRDQKRVESSAVNEGAFHSSSWLS